MLKPDAAEELTPRQREMAEALPHMIWTATPEGAVNYVSQAFYRYTGLGPVDLPSGGWLEAVHPDDRDNAVANWIHAVNAEEPYETEFRIYHTESGVYRWHLVASRPHRDASGRVVRWYGSTFDIHDRKLAEEAVRKSEERLRKIIEHEPECVTVVSQDGRLLDINPAGLRLIEADQPAQAIGCLVHQLVHPEDRSLFEEAHRQTLRGESTRIEYRIVGFRATERRLETVTTPLYGDRNAIDAVLSVSRDVTRERRDAELRALEARVLDAVSAGTSLSDILLQITLEVDRLMPGVSSSILLVEGGCLRHGAAPHLPEAYNRFVDGIAIGEGIGSCGTCASRRRQVIVVDIVTDPLWATFRELAAQHNLRACWSTPVLDSHGNVLATFGVYYDTPKAPTDDDIEFISRIGQYVRVAIERTRQHERLRESESRYRSIYDLVPVSIWEEDWTGVRMLLDEIKRRGVADCAPYLLQHPEAVRQALHAVRILNVNDITLEMFEATSKEQVLASLSTVFSTPEALPEFTRGLAAFAHDEPLYEAEVVLRTVRGNSRHMLLRIAFPDQDEPSSRVIVSMMDVTAWRQAEERFRVIAQATSDVIWDHNPADGAVWFSDGRKNLLGLQPGRIERGLEDMAAHIHPDDRHRVAGGIQVALLNGNRWKDEYRVARGDGHYVQVVNQGFVVRDKSGKAVRMIGRIVDVTEQKKLEEQLRQAQRLESIGQLTGGVAHDFNNLLTVILGNAEILGDHLADDPHLRAMAEMTARAAERGAELTSRLLAFARRQPLIPTITDIHRQIDGMDRLLRRTLGEHIEIHVVRAQDLWKVRVDTPQLEAAILNLCINARDAMPDGGTLTIETANTHLDAIHADGNEEEVLPGPYVMIAVADTGIGMDRATLERIFEPFFTTKEVGKGSGLGLSMVYGFVKQSRGHIRVCSEPGLGTTVRMYFPRSAEQEISAKPLPEETRAVRGSERILLVEDDPLVRTHVTALLTGLGYEVVTAVNGPEALAVLQKDGDFDLLFTDMVMPGGMNGRQLAEKAQELRPGIPVLFTTGYTEQDNLPAGQPQSAATLLHKPYHLQELAAALRRVLHEGRTVRDSAPTHE